MALLRLKLRLLRNGKALDNAAGDTRAGIAGRLGGKVVRILVDDNCPADHLVQAEAVGQEYRHRVAAAAEQRRKVSGVVRMGSIPPD